MDIGPLIRVLLAHPVSEPVPEVIGPIEEPLPRLVEEQGKPLPAELTPAGR